MLWKTPVALIGIVSAAVFTGSGSFPGTVAPPARPVIIGPSSRASPSGVRFKGGTEILPEDRRPESSFREQEFAWEMRQVQEAQAKSSASAEAAAAPNGSSERGDRQKSSSTHVPSPTSGRCRGDRTFLRIFDLQADLFCDDAGYTFPVLLNGDCPISACIMRYQNGGEDFYDELTTFGDQ